MMTSRGTVLLGFTLAGQQGLVGAAVVYLLSDAATHALRDGDWKSAASITKDHLVEQSPGSAYVSTIVAREGYGPHVAKGLEDWFVAAAFPEIFARPALNQGQRLAKKFGFTPVADPHDVWRRTAEPVDRDSLRRGLARMRLGRYDRSSARISRWSRILGWFVLAAAVPLLIGVPWVLAASFPDALTLIENHIPSLAPPLAGTAATLGGLASTIFFLTAQLKVSGFSQYGMTAIYRARTYAPLLLLTALTIALSLTALLLNTPVGGDRLASLSMTTAIVSHSLLIFVIILLSMRLVTNMDPVSLARQFAFAIRGSDGSEWGVVQISTSAKGESEYNISISSNRTNFGLRDPLMPVHELILAANAQRYGQLLSVLAERITRIYRLQWTMQFPDAHRWELLPAITGWGRAHHWLWRTREARFEPTKDRLQLTLLILHYFRRLHRNSDVRVKLDVRRQSIQFVIGRLMAVLVKGNQPGHTTRVVERWEAEGSAASRLQRAVVRVTARSRESMASRRSEVARVLTYCIDAILGVSVDFEASRSEEQALPHGRGEGLRGLIAATKTMANANYLAQAEHAARVISWIRAQENSPLAPERIPELSTVFAAYPWIDRIANGDPPAEPPFSSRNPWAELEAVTLQPSK